MDSGSTWKDVTGEGALTSAGPNAAWIGALPTICAGPLPGHPGARIGAPVLRCDARVRELAPCRLRRVGRGEPCHLLAAARSFGGVVGCGGRLRRVEHVRSGMAGATPRGRHVSSGRFACGQRTVLERPATPPGSLWTVRVPGSPRLNGPPELAAAGLRTCGVHT